MDWLRGLRHEVVLEQHDEEDVECDAAELVRVVAVKAPFQDQC